MITPTIKGKALLDDMHSAAPANGEACIWWLGQSGYAIKTSSELFYIDLYLSEHLTKKYADTEKPHLRMTEAPLRGAEIANASWVFASHKHSDHFDPETLPDLFAASPNAHLILPTALIDHAVMLGIPRERLIPTRGKETLSVGKAAVYSLPSAHPKHEYTRKYGYPFLGYVIQVDGLTIYHSGDTLAYKGLASQLRKFHPDILFLPINGTDARRDALNVPPNMNAVEAIRLAKRVGSGLVIPHHYDMFTFNTASWKIFDALAENAGIPHQILKAGERFTFRKA